MSQTNGAASCSGVGSVRQRERKLTEKGLINKVVNLQNERKGLVGKIKGLIKKDERTYEKEGKCF